MKKWFSVAMLCAVLFVAAAPEPAAAQNWNMILRFGGSNGYLKGHNALGSEGENGLIGGIAAELRMNENVAIEFGLSYLQKGASGTITNAVAEDPANPPPPDPTQTFEGTTELDYLEISGLVGVIQPVGDNADARFYLGLSLGNLLSAEAKGTYNGEPVDLDIKDTISTFDFQTIIGGTFGLDVKRVKLLLEFRAWIGLSDIENSILDVNITTRTYTATIGVLIPLTSYE